MSEPYRQYVCVIDGHVYDEASGDPEAGIPPGTRWSEVPETYECPVCGASKADFEPAPLPV